MPWKDPEAKKAYNRNLQREKRKNPEYRAEENRRQRYKYQNFTEEERAEYNKKQCKAHRARYVKNKTQAIEYTGGIQCHGEDCRWNGELRLRQIDFHHVISENKTQTFGHLFRKCSWEKCKEEIDNCEAIPLCANCHNSLHG